MSRLDDMNMNDLLHNGHLNEPTTLAGSREFRVQGMKSIPPNVNPFTIDMYHQGTPIADGKEWLIMFDSNENYLIIIHRPTGHRVKINRPEE
jgi:hypothetical protein